MLETIVVVIVSLMVAAGVCGALLRLAWGLYTIPERRRELRAHEEYDRLMFDIQKQRNADPLKRLQPGKDWQDIPGTVQHEAERSPWLRPWMSAAERTAKLEHWHTLRANYGYVPVKPRCRVYPTVHPVGP